MFNFNKINDLIHIKKLKLKEVSAGAGLNHSTFTNKILNEKANPYAENIEKLADFLQIPIDELFDRNIKIDYVAYYQAKEKGTKKGIAAEPSPGYGQDVKDKLIAQLEEQVALLRTQNEDQAEMLRAFRTGAIKFVESAGNDLDGKCG